MPDSEQERKTWEAHLEKIEADTRKGRAKAEERGGIVVPEGSGADGERG
jgi:hypothetical protein